MEKRQKKLIIPFIALLVLAILITGIALLVKKYMPSSKEMSLDDYFKVSKGEMQVILQDQIYDTKALYDNGEIYVDFGLVHDSLNSRFYWDAEGEPAFVYHIDCSDICGGGQQRLLYE